MLLSCFQAASYKGTLRDEQGNVIIGATVVSEDGKHSTVTNSKGYFRLNKLNSEVEHFFTISHQDFISLKEAVNLKPATSKTVKLVMQPLV